MSEEFAAPPMFEEGAENTNPKQEANVTEQSTQQEKKTRSTTTLTREHIDFIQNNVKKMGYQEMADSLGISRNQVNRALQDVKKRLRNRIMEAAEQNNQEAYAKKDNGKPDYNQPLIEGAKKIEAYIQEHLSRPADTRPGAGKKGGGVNAAIDNKVDEILNSL